MANELEAGDPALGDVVYGPAYHEVIVYEATGRVELTGSAATWFRLAVDAVKSCGDTEAAIRECADMVMRAAESMVVVPIQDENPKELTEQQPEAA